MGSHRPRGTPRTWQVHSLIRLAESFVLRAAVAEIIASSGVGGTGESWQERRGDRDRNVWLLSLRIVEDVVRRGGAMMVRIEEKKTGVEMVVTHCEYVAFWVSLSLLRRLCTFEL